MKRCPSCNDFALYDDSIDTCPICGTTLIRYRRRKTMAIREDSLKVIEPVSYTPELTREYDGGTPEFETREGFNYVYRGTVTEISSHVRYHNRFKKIVNALLRGEPYQFGNTSHETVFRIEGFHDGLVSGRKRDLIFYGDIEGRINYGDDVIAIARKLGDRYVVIRLYSNETESQIKAPPQIPASLFWILDLVVIFGIICLISSGVLFDILIYAILIVSFLIFLGVFFSKK